MNGVISHGGIFAFLVQQMFLHAMVHHFAIESYLGNRLVISKLVQTSCDPYYMAPPCLESYFKLTSASEYFNFI